MPKIASDMGGRPYEGAGQSTSPRGTRTLSAPRGRPRPSEEEPSEQVTDPEEEQDPDRDDGGDQAHHREQRGAGTAIHARILAEPVTARRGRARCRSGSQPPARRPEEVPTRMRRHAAAPSRSWARPLPPARL